ncbi:phage/plasmid replication protein, II/X family [Novosphingobium naphthalenivorans]|uniref:phage/plasmid replication protein, II/X family n=1 Tax=Novosphingobium naphthalenivorans TaxID=273168 RepID=UPI000835DF93|nr:phage/plasmid replication protein, II/X family [Novosphingobium naphthalenivorans]
MVDWLKVECPDPFGQVIDAGHVMSVRQDGSLEWATAKRLRVQGSHSSSYSVRNVMGRDIDDEELPVSRHRYGLQLDGNPSKFLQGHNLFGPADPLDLLERTVAKVGDALGIKVGWADYGLADIQRIDLTSHWLLDREGDVLPFLQAMQERVFVPYRGRGTFHANKPETLYYGYVDKGKRQPDWKLKIYWKGEEIRKNDPMLWSRLAGVPGAHEELLRTVRVELTLLTPELKRLKLRKVGAWSPEMVAYVWALYVDRLDFGALEMNLDLIDTKMAGLKPRHQHAIAAWKAGNDLREGMSHRSFYRLRKDILAACGFDIKQPPPKSNVVPLMRIVTAKPALHPIWADDLTSALMAA